MVAQVELRNLGWDLEFELEWLIHEVDLKALEMLERFIVLLQVGLSQRFYRLLERNFKSLDIFISFTEIFFKSFDGRFFKNVTSYQDIKVLVSFINLRPFLNLERSSSQRMDALDLEWLVISSTKIRRGCVSCCRW